METVTKRVSRERLQLIVAHLRKPQAELSLDRFNFARVAKDSGCGTNGCAMGEYPAIWPDDFCYDIGGDGRMFNVVSLENGRSVHKVNPEWLGIPENVNDALFFPYANDDDGDTTIADDLYDAGVRGLPDDATKSEVADNIQAYIDAFLTDAIIAGEEEWE